ncbi:glycosyltransferase [Roseospira marina]|uniref:Glycosyltransferase n=1 Tax=Roseospira marina TaxID=140057 RepID=A0A5M6I8T6_9PROT|nr:glycosyltransferase [Roseospira marina]KAA5604674.1 glycosyltransferase [Roseospira marina]MBB4315120.1 hypothetical protein [Roseospira marina]MBB5088110.1 hypothetical protein [Roseospira marina]
MTDLSILVVSYNTRALLLDALAAVRDVGCSRPYEVIVLDNASSDGSADAVAEHFPEVRLIRSEDNHGFAKGNNIAAQEARGAWLLLLNPDTALYPGALDTILAFGEAHPKGGIYGGRTYFPDGSLNIASCWGRSTPWSLFCSAFGLTALFPRSALFHPERMGDWARDTEREVDIVVGCFLLIRKSLWDELGGFDTRFWMYGEDADLCLRARALGYRPRITPDAGLMHIIGASSSTSGAKLALLAKGRATLIRRHWSAVWRPWGRAMQWAWVANRYAASAVLSTVLPRRFGPARDKWAAVWRSRADWRNGYS